MIPTSFFLRIVSMRDQEYTKTLGLVSLELLVTENGVCVIKACDVRPSVNGIQSMTRHVSSQDTQCISFLCDLLSDLVSI